MEESLENVHARGFSREEDAEKKANKTATLPFFGLCPRFNSPRAFLLSSVLFLLFLRVLNEIRAAAPRKTASCRVAIAANFIWTPFVYAQAAKPAKNRRGQESLALPTCPFCLRNIPSKLRNRAITRV